MPNQLPENDIEIVKSGDNFTLKIKDDSRWLAHSKVDLEYWLYWDTYNWDIQHWFMHIFGATSVKNEWVLNVPDRIYSETLLVLAPPPANRKFWTVFANIYREITLPYTIDRYMELPTWEHRRPKFLEILRFLIQPLVDMQNEAYVTSTRKYNVDFSTGYELDVIGKWVGITRDIYPPIQDVYITWDTPGLGWDQGRWHKYGAIVVGVTQLPDDIYRILIKAKIAANHWDGTVDSIYTIWNSIFGYEIFAGVVDHQDMSMDLILALETDDAMLKTVIKNEKIPLRPAGVKVNYIFTVRDPEGNAKAVFYWDRVETKSVSGVWDSAGWYKFKIN